MVSVHSITISCLSVIVKQQALFTIHLEIVNKIQLNRIHQFYQTTLRHYALLLSKHFKLSGKSYSVTSTCRKLINTYSHLLLAGNPAFMRTLSMILARKWYVFGGVCPFCGKTSLVFLFDTSCIITSHLSSKKQGIIG